MACKRGNLEAIKNVVALAGPNHVAEGSPGLMHALKSHNDVAISYFLSCAELDINTTSWCGDTCLIVACTDAPFYVEKLLKHPGIDVNRVNRHGSTALMYACSSGYTVAVCDLLKKTDIDVNAQDTEGRTALHYAVASGRDMIVDQLLQRGDLCVNSVRAWENTTALGDSIILGFDDISEALIRDRRTSHDAVSGFYGDALKTALCRNRPRTVHNLLEHRDIDVSQMKTPELTICEYAKYYYSILSPKCVAIIMEFRAWQCRRAFLHTGVALYSAGATGLLDASEARQDSIGSALADSRLIRAYKHNYTSRLGGKIARFL